MSETVPGIEIYNKHGHVWLESKASDVHTKEILEILINHISILGESPCILDLACGYGRLTLPLLEKGWDVLGVDLSPVLIEEAERRRKIIKLGNENTFRIGDMKEIPFPNSQFDFCFCVWASLNFLVTWEDQMKSFREFYRILKPGGSFFIEIPFHDEELPKVQEIETKGMKYLYFPFTRGYLENILSKISFQFYSMEEIKIANRKRIVVYMKK